MSRNLVLVVGNSRSGTTMLGRVLSRHHQVFTFRELHFFEQLCAPNELNTPIIYDSAVSLFAMLIALQRDGYMLVKEISPSYLKEAADHLTKIGIASYTPMKVYEEFLFYETVKEGKSIPCEQTPRNIFYLRDILECFSDRIKCIVMVRDPRDVLLSQKRKWKRRQLGMLQLPWHESVRTWINYHPVTISLLWRSVIRSSAFVRHDPRVMHVQYEEFLSQPEVELNKICNFLGISYQPEMLAISMFGSSNITDDTNLVGIDSGRMGQWKLPGGLNEIEIWLCQYITSSEMKRLGYLPMDIHLSLASYIILLGYLMLFPIKLAFAVLMNLRRMRNPFSSIFLRLKNL